METIKKIEVFIDKEKEGTYFQVPFEVPDDVSRIDIKYSYPRYLTVKNGISEKIYEKNIIDLGLVNADGEFVGASGSNKTHIWVSEYSSSLGYAKTKIKKGKWAIIVGAYKIMDGGVSVEYEITFTHKERVLLKGDLHVHTLCSDGNLSVEEVIFLAKKAGLDYIFITDHNNYFHNNTLRSDDDITVMPGVEWTHFKGHVNMLGIEKAFDGVYYTNTLEETQEKLRIAREKGAIVSINHPFCTDCGFKWGLENVEYDCIEIWNGPMKRSEMECIKWWHDELCKGRKIPIVGGSDFHKHEIGRGIGLPTTCLYSISRAPSDIYAAIREGTGFVTYMPNGPTVYMECDGKILGQTVEYRSGIKINFVFAKLHKDDIIKIITNKSVEEITCDADVKEMVVEKELDNVMFYRVEIYRHYINDFPSLPVLISNPLYVDCEY
ncbi:CehA/McbA family metallohydrolase [Caldicoprobacter faecalis]|uniref:Polymerase/histidinol phosphatase N-terminal domain-containing protein n=1 Tax=Caldicoprobacter faecalis TaxID=937334 RepID=A0A1I5YXS8_9FIRM|nr:CehA/McbA family metallohydrolase [Caldicoprobacter faecalis]SFQ48930.1 hypothetical protein SAMN05444406_1752 [Caldicoprobacter faecalis]